MSNILVQRRRAGIKDKIARKEKDKKKKTIAGWSSFPYILSYILTIN